MPTKVEGAPENNLPIIREGMTLWSIMDVLDQMERGLLDLDQTEMTTIGTVARSKIDGYKQFIDMAGSVGDMISKWEDELCQARKSVESKVAGL